MPKIEQIPAESIVGSVNLINTLESRSGKGDSALVSDLMDQGFDGVGFVEMWRNALGGEKQRLIKAAYRHLGADGITSVAPERVGMGDLKKAVAGGGGVEDWMDLDHLSAYVSYARANGKKLGKTDNRVIREECAAVVDGQEKTGYFVRGAREKLSSRVSTNHLVQAVDNLIGNAYDAIDPRNQMGMFASGVKVLESLVKEKSVKVVVKTRKNRESHVLRMQRSIGGRAYVNLSSLDEVKSVVGNGIRSKTGTKVEILGLNLSKQERDSLIGSLSFNSGIIGNGVELKINQFLDRGETNSEFWGRRHTIDGEVKGKIRVKIGKNKIVVSDSGCGMNREGLECLFVPRQGTKKAAMLNGKDLVREVERNGYVEVISTNSGKSRLVLKRRTEILKVVELNKNLCGLVDGDVAIECGLGLHPSGEGRRQSGIFIDSTLVDVLKVIVDKIVHEEKPAEDKVKLLSTIYEGVEELLSELGTSDGEVAAVKSLKLAKKEISRSCNSILFDIQPRYCLIPGEKSYLRLEEGEKPFFQVSKGIIDSFGAFQMDGLGVMLDERSGVVTSAGYRVFKAKLKGIEVDQDIRLFFERLVRDENELLPVIVDDKLKIVIVDEQYWDRYLTLCEIATKVDATEMDKWTVMACREALASLMNTSVMTSYEISGVHNLERPISVIQPRQNISIEIKEPRAIGLEGNLYLSQIGGDLPFREYRGGMFARISAEYISRKEFYDGDNEDDRRASETVKFRMGNREFLFVRSFSKINLYSFDENGVLTLEKGQVENIGHKFDSRIFVGQRNGEQVLYMIDQEKKQVGWCKTEDFLRDNSLVFQWDILRGVDEIRYLETKLIPMEWDDGLSYLAIGETELGGGYRSCINHLVLQDKGEYCVSDESILEMGYISWMGSYEVNGGKRLLVVGGSGHDFFLIEMGNTSGEFKEIRRTQIGPFAGLDSSKIVNFGGTDYLFLVSSRGEITPIKLSDHSVGSIFRIDQSFGSESMRDFELMDYDERGYLLMSDYSLGYICIAKFDKETGEVTESVDYRLPEIENGYLRLESHFVSRDGELPLIFYTSEYQGRGVIELFDNGRLSVEKRLGDDWSQRRDLLVEMERALSNPEYDVFPDDVIEELVDTLIGHQWTIEEWAGMVDALDNLRQNEAFRSYYDSEMRTFANSLPDKVRKVRADYFLSYHVLMAARTGAQFDQKRHLELIAEIGPVYDAERRDAFFDLIDTVNVEKEFPLLEERMKFYRLLDHLTRSDGMRSESGIDRLKERLVHLQEKEVFGVVVNKLINGLPKEGEYVGKPLEEYLSHDRLPFYYYLIDDAEILREVDRQPGIYQNRETKVAGIAYLAKSLGAKSIKDMEKMVYQQYGKTLDEYFESGSLDLSEFEKDWRIAVHFSGGNGVEQREIVQNGDDAIKRRRTLYGGDFKGRMVYDYYVQSTPSGKYFVQDITDNGCGMSDYARLCFAVSGMSDKGLFGKTQSGEFGIGFSSNYRRNDLVVVDTVRMIEEGLGLRGHARDVYRVTRKDGFADELYLVGTFENNDIDQEIELGTRIRLFMSTSGIVPAVEAIVSRVSAMGYGWLTTETSKEYVGDGSQGGEIDIQTVGGDEETGIVMKGVNIGYKLVDRVSVGETKAVSLYEGSGAIPNQIALDGRWVCPIGDEVREKLNPEVQRMMEKYRLAINVHDFTPNMDRGDLVEKDDLGRGVALLLTKFAAKKLLEDSEYFPYGMPVDFRSNPSYLGGFETISPDIIKVVKKINDGVVLNTEEVNLMSRLDPDSFNFILASVEQGEGDLRTSVLIQRTGGFISAYENKQLYGDRRYKQEYINNLSRAYEFARLVSSSGVLKNLENGLYREWFKVTERQLTWNENISFGVENVTSEYVDDGWYAFMRDLFSSINVDRLWIGRGMLVNGVYMGGGTVMLNETLINNGGWAETSLHEGGHKVEEGLRSLGLGSAYTHQQKGTFEVSYKATAWAFLNKMMGIK